MKIADLLLESVLLGTAGRPACDVPCESNLSRTDIVLFCQLDYRRVLADWSVSCWRIRRHDDALFLAKREKLGLCLVRMHSIK